MLIQFPKGDHHMSDSPESATLLRRVVLSLPTVSDVVVQKDDQGREAVVLDGLVTGPQVRAAVSAAGLRAPERVVVVPSMPHWDRGASEAGDRWATLRRDPSVLVYDFAAPQGEVQEALCAIWCEVLRLPEVGVQDDLLDLGGSSLTAIEIATRIEEHFGVECDLDLVFQAGTVSALAAELERLGEQT